MSTSESRLRVVVADPNREFQTVARSWLERHPGIAAVHVTDSSVEVLDLVSSEPIDLVLVDSVLSDRDGFETTRRLKSLPKPPLVVILVLFGYEAVREAARLAGADACVAKSALTQQLDPILDDMQLGRRGPGADEPGHPADPH